MIKMQNEELFMSLRKRSFIKIMTLKEIYILMFLHQVKLKQVQVQLHFQILVGIKQQLHMLDSMDQVQKGESR